MPVFTDQIGRKVEIRSSPKKIISIVPSQTELLFYLGLNNEVAGITKFCIHPAEWFRTKQRVGGTKNLNLQKIKELQPDLIIANKEENVQEQIEVLEKNFPVWVSDVNNLEDALLMIKEIGKITAKEKEATKLTEKIFSNFNSLQHQNHKLAAAYLIWKDPYMTIGGDTFINNMLLRAGFENIFSDKNRYPETTIEELQNKNCTLLLLSSEPYPFKQKHIDELKKFLPATKILLVDGEMFSWYGSRLLHAPEYFQGLHQQINVL